MDMDDANKQDIGSGSHLVQGQRCASALRPAAAAAAGKPVDPSFLHDVQYSARTK